MKLVAKVRSARKSAGPPSLLSRRERGAKISPGRHNLTRNSPGPGDNERCIFIRVLPGGGGLSPYSDLATLLLIFPPLLVQIRGEVTEPT